MAQGYFELKSVDDLDPPSLLAVLLLRGVVEDLRSPELLRRREARQFCKSPALGFWLKLLDLPIEAWQDRVRRLRLA